MSHITHCLIDATCSPPQAYRGPFLNTMMGSIMFITYDHRDWRLSRGDILAMWIVEVVIILIAAVAL